MKKYAPCSNTDKAVDKEKRKDLIIDLSICAVGVALLVFRFCFLTSSEILSGSMELTLMTGDYAIFQEFSLRKTYSLLCRILVVAF